MDVLVNRVVFILSVIIALIILGKIVSIATDTSCTITMRVKEYFNRKPSSACITKTIHIKDEAQSGERLQEEAYRCLNTYAHNPQESLGTGSYCIPCARITLPHEYRFTELRDLLSQPLNGHAFLTTYQHRQDVYGRIHQKDILIQSDSMLAHAPGNPSRWESQTWRLLFIQDTRWAGFHTSVQSVVTKGITAYHVWEGVIILPVPLDEKTLKTYCPETLPVGRVVKA